MIAVLKTYSHWFLYCFLIVAGAAAMVLSKSDTVVVHDLRTSVENVTVPALETFSQPAELLATGVEQFRHWLSVGEDNARLREERLRLLQWEAIARRLHAENEQLRQLLNFVPPPEAKYVSARIVSDSAGMFARSVLLNAGREHGVSKHDVVIAGRGVVGRIVSVANSASRVLLVTDLNSRIPVLIGPLKTRAILAGDNTDQPKLIHLPPNAAVSIGDRIATSGHGGVFPPGLPLGVVSTTEHPNTRIDLYANVDKTEFVRVANFDLDAIYSSSFDAANDFEPAHLEFEPAYLETIAPVSPEVSQPAP